MTEKGRPWPGAREMAAAIHASLEQMAPSPHDPSPAVDSARILAQALSESFNAVIPFAAPRLHERWSSESREDMLVLRDACVALLDKLQSVAPALAEPLPFSRLPFSISTGAVSEMRDALGAWDGAMPPPPSLQQAAQDLLTSSGVPDPPGGWAAFDVPNADGTR